MPASAKKRPAAAPAEGRQTRCKSSQQDAFVQTSVPFVASVPTRCRRKDVSAGPKTISLATDCSGMESPVVAACNVGLDVQHVMSSDVDKGCQRFIQANFEPDVLFEDMSKRDNASPTVPKSPDGYIA
eukprot:656254-Alexandrium_andersonii.AAC.1